MSIACADYLPQRFLQLFSSLDAQAVPSPPLRLRPRARLRHQTVTEATENEVASVLAEYEPDWRETIDAAGNCRFLWVFDSDDVTDRINAMGCYTREQTIVIEAQIVTRDWGELNVPASMTKIVDETSSVLTKIGEADLTTVCGEDGVPAGTDECTAVIGSLNMLYTQLES